MLSEQLLMVSEQVSGLSSKNRGDGAKSQFNEQIE